MDLDEKITPIHGNIVVVDDKQKEKTSHGIILPETRMPDQVITGIVLSVSPTILDNGTLLEPEVAIGDKVLYRFVAGQTFQVNKEGCASRVVSPADILGKIVG